MQVNLVLFLDAFGRQKIETEANLNVLPREGDTLDHEGQFFKVSTVVLSTTGGLSTVVGIITDNPY